MLRLHARNPILIVAAAAVIVVGAIAVLSPQIVTRNVGISSQPEFERVMVAPRAFAPAPTAAPAPAPQGASETGLQIARSGSIDILVSNVDETMNRISQLARADGGDVFALDAQSANDGHGSQSATMTVKVPASRFDAIMSNMSALGGVRSRSVRAEDLSSNITDSSARLRNLKRTEADTLKIMDRSGRVGEIMDVENQLSSVREQIETLEAEVASMHSRVAYSTIDIMLEAEAQSAPAEPGALTQIRNTFAAATHSLGDATLAVVAGCIWVAVFLPYVIALAVLLWVLRLGLRKYAVRR